MNFIRENAGKWALKALVLVSTCLVAGRLAAATTEVVADDPGITDANGAPSYTFGDGFVTVSFQEQAATAMPEYNAATVVADTSGSGSVFAGDYAAAGVKGATFKIRSELNAAKPVQAMLVLQAGASGRLWRNENVNVSAVQGVWTLNTIGMDRAAGWTRDGGGDLDAMWLEDLKNVDLIGVRLAQPGLEAQSYSISEFKLFGDGFATPIATLTPLEKALMLKFGVTNANDLASWQKALDSNGNGMTDLFEILSEYDFLFANSIFVAEIVEGDKGPGILIRWPCVRNWKYTVMRANSLLASFQGLASAVGLVATNTGYMTYRDTTATGEGPYFYRIKRSDY